MEEEKKELKNFALVGFMEELAKRRPVFHNECDFQFEFAMLAKELYDTDVRLECYFPSEKISQEENKKRIKRNYIDIVLFNRKQECILIELKYKVKELGVEIRKELKEKSRLHEDFNLPNHDATDEGTYAYLADLKRLEKLCKDGKGKFNGYEILSYHSILLTNDNRYYGKHDRSVFKDFYLTEKEDKEEQVLKKLSFPKETKTSKKVGGDLPFIKTYDYRWYNYGKNQYGLRWVDIEERKEDEVKK